MGTRQSGRWRKVAGAGTIVASLAATAPRAALACDETPAPSGVQAGFFLGLSFAPRVRPVYGVDVRFAAGRTAGFARVEGRGLLFLRLVSGVQVAGATTAGEVGLALHGGHGGVGRAAGLHLGTALYDPAAALQLQGMLPLVGDEANHDFSAAAFVVPENICLSFGAAGRPLRDDEGRPVLPGAVAPGGGSPAARALLGGWIEACRAEYASIGTFVRLAAELAALGAPGGLVRAARRAAADEARHAAQVASLARGPILLVAPSPAAARPRFTRPSPAAFASLVREAYLDGCQAEAIAAASVAEAARRARDEDTAATLAGIALDEARHAALAWEVLSWARAAGGPGAGDALAAALDSDQPPRDMPAASTAHDEDWLAAMGQASAPAPIAAAIGECAHARARSLL